MRLKSLVNALALVAAMTLATNAMAVTHEVTIEGLRFVPNDITIAPGDTVRWSWSTGVPHDVTADDGSFSSGAATTMDTYERTFNSIGEILYHCSVHSSPGRDIDSNMNGRITVEEDTAPEPPFINAAMSDAWYNPATGGQGFFFTVWPEIRTVFISWFTYEVERPPEEVEAILGEPGHRWVTAIGEYEPGDEVTLDVELTEGMVFDSPEPAKTQTPGYGTITITFVDCANAVLSYEFPSLGLSGVIELVRLSNDNVGLCETLSAEAQSG